MTLRSSVADPDTHGARDHGHDHPHPHDHDHPDTRDHSHDDDSHDRRQQGSSSDRNGNAATRRRIRRMLSGGMVVAIVGLGIAVGRATSDDTGSNGDTASNGAAAQGSGGLTTQPTPAGQTPPPATPAKPLHPVAAGAVAATPSAAVQSFLQAEIDGRYADSLAILVDDERARLGPSDVWEANHAQLPEYLGFTVDGVDGARVTTTVTLQPNLDEVTGLTAARQQIVWTAVPQGGGWRVATDSTDVRALYPDAAGASTAAIAWVQARQACQRGDQYPGNLLGQPEVADALCGSTAAARATATTTLDSYPNPTVVVSAFGPDAAEWARVVRIAGPASIDVVTAPLGERWVVVGVSVR
jgi:hypothetical protein